MSNTMIVGQKCIKVKQSADHFQVSNGDVEVEIKFIEPDTSAERHKVYAHLKRASDAKGADHGEIDLGELHKAVLKLIKKARKKAKKK